MAYNMHYMLAGFYPNLIDTVVVCGSSTTLRLEHYGDRVHQQVSKA